MPEWPNSHKLKIQDGGGRHLEFRKNVNNFGLDKDILHQIIWEDAPRRRGEAECLFVFACLKEAANLPYLAIIDICKSQSEPCWPINRKRIVA